MVKKCKRLRNYRARTKNGRVYKRSGLHCKTCGRRITKLVNDMFDGECLYCKTIDF